MFAKLLYKFALFLSRFAKQIKLLLQLSKYFLLGLVAVGVLSLIIGKLFQNWDDDPDRGAIAIQNGAFDESYSTPVYLDQGWDEADSLWFYNTTQGSGLMSYDLFLELEEADSAELLRSNANMDRYRYLPQKPTFFNPDGLPVGFTKDAYQGHDYIGFTCAACHTGQVNYKNTAIRIDGGPSMADMVGFLTALEQSLNATIDEDAKFDSFVERVLALNNDYSSSEEIKKGLEEAAATVMIYNTVNHSELEYGYSRLDAFGRIYNRVLQHVLNRDQVERLLALAMNPDGSGQRLLTQVQINAVLHDINETLIDDEQFNLVLERLQLTGGSYPGLTGAEVLVVRNEIFNAPNAPVSYPFLWDIVQSTYVQWNGLAGNSGSGPIGRNAGEVVGVFGILDWEVEENNGFTLAAFVSGQQSLEKRITFNSSINMTNLRRLESHLRYLESPEWPAATFPGEADWRIDEQKRDRGELLYNEYCLSCHQVVQRDNLNRIVVSEMLQLDAVKTDPTMASNSVSYTGNSGNFEGTYQTTDVGPVVIQEIAPVIQILTAATGGVIATPDHDKWFFRRWAERLYTLIAGIIENPLKPSIKAGDYKPDTTSTPYASLESYKARSLNGIWATAPYLHNGSVPSLYDLLLPKRRPGDPAGNEYRPDSFMVGSREFDPVRVGLRTEGYAGTDYDTTLPGNFNSGHEYAAGLTPQAGQTEPLPAMSADQRWDLVEYLKTL